MLCSQTLFRLLIIFLFSHSSRALDPRVRHIEGDTDVRPPSMSFKRFKSRDGLGATRSDASKQQFLDLGSAGLGTYLGGVLQGVEHVASDMIGNEWRPDNAAAAAAADTTNRTKYVVAHFMVGNTYPYKVEDWKKDISHASAYGIDAFALNIGREDWMPARVADAYSAAKALNSKFKLFISFDMTSLACTAQQDISLLQGYITRYAAHPNQFIYNGKPFASTFSGEGCSYGGNFKSAWTAFKKGLNGNVHFVPSFFIDPAGFKETSAMDGAFNWNSGWPIALNNQSSSNQVHLAITHLSQGDQSYIQNLGGRTYMAAVSPWFFTHYGPDTYNKNFLYYADRWLYPSRWEQLIANRDAVDIVEIISWNDYGESHYIGPIAGAQPNSQAWVDGFDHQGWLDMTAYYASAFKTGAYPTIQRDKVYVWARPHPRGAPSSDYVPRPKNYELVNDHWYAVVFAVQPTTVVLSSPQASSARGDTDYRSAVILDVQPGVTKLRCPLAVNGTMRVQLQRGESTVLDYVADGFVFNGSPLTYNFNAWVGWKASS